MFRVISVLVTMLILLSCGTTTKKLPLSANSILPRKGYIFVKKTVRLRKCLENTCMQGEFVSMGSGFVVNVSFDGAYIMTAAHVCVEKQSDYAPDIKLKVRLQAETLDGRLFNATMLEYNSKMDICMMYIEDLTSEVEAVKVAESAPVPGDKVYNIASPYGIHLENIVPIFEGRFLGKKGIYSYYRFEAAPGSSGSMILNSEGKLIGLLHSVYRKMHSIILSATHADLKNFIKKAIRNHKRKKNINLLIEFLMDL